MNSNYQFPAGFRWGAASAALQVEGSPNAENGGVSTWQTLYQRPGAIVGDGDLGRACEHFQRFRDDVRLMKELGISDYRFSIAWPRVFPDGDGSPNPRGLDFYQQLIDELLDNGITPWVTMFHWETPQALEDRWGGWRDKRTAHKLADYVSYVVPRISDRVKDFFTVNEIGCFTAGGYGTGSDGFPPALKCEAQVVNQTIYNGCLAHGLTVQAIRAAAIGPVEIGIADNPGAFTPLIATQENIEACKQAFVSRAGSILTLIMEGRHREEYLRQVGDAAPVFTEDELKVIHEPLDFLGLNIYHGHEVVADASAPEGYRMIAKPVSFPKLDMPWLDFTPSCTYWTLRFIHELWRPRKIFVSENGAACIDKINPDDGEIYDSDRILFINNYLDQIHRAIAEGVPVKGYFYWSLMDNLEWRWGEAKRFGLYYVNFKTQKRILKQSGKYYREIIRRNALI